MSIDLNDSMAPNERPDISGRTIYTPAGRSIQPPANLGLAFGSLALVDIAMALGMYRSQITRLFVPEVFVPVDVV
jgi:hypothetical protein